MFFRHVFKRLSHRYYISTIKARHIAQNRCLSTASSPLKDIRICDFTSGTAGPYCSMLLGDHGAEVIKIESLEGDESRQWGPPFVGQESCMFFVVNRNKKSVCIDIKTDDGADLLYEIIKKSDVFIENFVPGKLTELGFGYEQLKEINPKLIYASISGFGSHGPYHQKPGYDVTASAFGGLLSITGPKNGEVCAVGVPVTEIMTALYTSSAITASLYERKRSGKGKKVESSLSQTQLAFLCHVGANYLNAGVVGKTIGTSHASIVPYQAFQTNDEMIILAGTNEKLFRNTCNVLGLQHLPEDPKFATNEMRVKNRDRIIDILQERLLTKSSKHWIDKLEEVGVPCATLNSVEKVFNDPQVKALSMIQEIEHSTAGEIKIIGTPIEYNGQLSSDCPVTPPPLLGQHSCEVVKSLLEYSDDHIESLIQKGVLRQSKNSAESISI